jgi:hypothetical protein
MNDLFIFLKKMSIAGANSAHPNTMFDTPVLGCEFLYKSVESIFLPPCLVCVRRARGVEQSPGVIDISLKGHIHMIVVVMGDTVNGADVAWGHRVPTLSRKTWLRSTLRFCLTCLPNDRLPRHGHVHSCRSSSLRSSFKQRAIPGGPTSYPDHDDSNSTLPPFNLKTFPSSQGTSAS